MKKPTCGTPQIPRESLPNLPALRSRSPVGGMISKVVFPHFSWLHLVSPRSNEDKSVRIVASKVARYNGVM